MLLFCLVVAIWAGGLTGPYQFDDRVTPLSDPASQSLTAWVTYLPVTLRPLTKLTYALEASLGWAETPAPRRLLSILLLALAAVILMQSTLRLGHRHLSTGVAFAGALLWGIHPVHSENLLQISGRTVILSTLLVLGALLAALGGHRWWSASLLLLAGLARETALAAILLLAAVELTRTPQARGRSIRDWIPLLAAGLLLCGWYVSTSRYWELADYSFRGRPLLASLSAQIAAVPEGLKLLAHPEGLSVDYGIPLPQSVRSAGFVAGLATYLSFGSILALGVWRKSRALALGAAVWLAAVLPTQSMVPKLDALSSRPLSLALAGVVILAALPAAELVGRSRIAKLTLLVAATGLVFWLGSWTLLRQRLYASELLLWQDAASKSVTNPRPHLYYGILLKGGGRLSEARFAFETAGRIDPFDSRIAAILKQFEQMEKSP